MILGPVMAPGNKVLEAIHALYYLPENFKLILTGSKNVDQSFFNSAKSLVEHDGLGNRVQFDGQADKPNAVIASESTSPGANTVSGDTPEALASDILRVFRS